MTKSNDPNDKYAYLHELSYKKLMELLFAAPVQSNDPEDEAYVDALEEVILKREEDNPTGLLPDIEQQWHEFQTYYRTTEDVDEPDISQEDEQLLQADTVNPSLTVKHLRFGRVLAVVAVIVVLIVLMVPAALGFNHIFDMVGHWTSEYFQFVPDQEITADASTNAGSAALQETEFETPQDALEAYGVTEKVLPTWFPSGFVLSEISVTDLPTLGKNEFTFLYSGNTTNIVVAFTQYADNIRSRTYQKDNASIQEYEVNNILHYLYSNLGNSCSSWYIGNMECSISGDISMEELKTMINSIYDE